MLQLAARTGWAWTNGVEAGAEAWRARCHGVVGGAQAQGRGESRASREVLRLEGRRGGGCAEQVSIWRARPQEPTAAPSSLTPRRLTAPSGLAGRTNRIVRSRSPRRPC